MVYDFSDFEGEETEPAVDPMAKALAGTPSAAVAKFISDKARDVYTGKDALDYDTMVAAAKGDPEARQRVAEASNQIAMGSIQGVGGKGPKPKALPMDEASRMARAKEMGFDTDKTLYHGTMADISEFDAKRNINGRAYGDGTYLTSRPNEASDYAAAREKYPDRNGNLGWKPGGNVLPVHAKMENPFNLDHPASDEFKELVLGESGLSKSIKDKVKAADDNFSIYGYLINNLPSSRFTDLLKRAGYDSLQAPHANTSVVFEPSQIRSRFATFDPKKKGSGNISAGVAGASALGASQYDFSDFDDEGGL